MSTVCGTTADTSDHQLDTTSDEAELLADVVQLSAPLRRFQTGDRARGYHAALHRALLDVAGTVSLHARSA